MPHAASPARRYAAANTLCTGAGLVALILTFAPISGSHFNPAVTMAAAATGAFPWRLVPGYVLVQLMWVVAGVVCAHAMFELPLISLSQHARTGTGQWLSEFIATFGLFAVIGSAARHHARLLPVAVGAYITAAYRFTASTSFANPAVTLARALSDTFAGIRLGDTPAFIAAQGAGAAAATALSGWLHSRPRERALPPPGRSPVPPQAASPAAPQLAATHPGNA